MSAYTIHKVVRMNCAPCRKMFPYGVSNFNQIFMDKCFYVYKTIAFQKLEKSGRNLKLWRPRRCGKSLLRDQLKLYCDKLNADSTVRFYDFISLQLACKKPTPNRAKYLVLKLSFS